MSPLCLRLEMSAELLRQKELENLHQQRQQQQRLLGSEHLAALPPGIPPDHPALRSLHDIPEGHPLREELLRRSNAMLVLRHGTAAPLLALSQQQQQQQQAGASLAKEAQSSASGSDADARKAARRGPQTLLRAGDHTGGRECDREDEEMKESDSEAETCEERPDGAGGKSSSKPRDGAKEPSSKGGCDGAKEAREGESSGRLSAPCSSAGTESPSRHILTPGPKTDLKYHLPPGLMPPLPGLPQTLPFGFPYANPYFHTGEHKLPYFDLQTTGPHFI